MEIYLRHHYELPADAVDDFVGPFASDADAEGHRTLWGPVRSTVEHLATPPAPEHLFSVPGHIAYLEARRL